MFSLLASWISSWIVLLSIWPPLVQAMRAGQIRELRYGDSLLPFAFAV
jgi:hypothetical protein